AVIVGWTHPLITDADGNPTAEKKPEESWTKEEDEASTWNHKALNALFNGVDKNMFRLIKRCDVAKDAWDILQTFNEGTKKVKMSKLQILTTQFE
ncbi:gag-pol polyprotein, partial [Trifolium medium]|nr:gag-pol polyprotein [Trifolium medium]